MSAIDNVFGMDWSDAQYSNYAMIIPPDSEYGRLVPWHKSLWGYLYEQGVI